MPKLHRYQFAHQSQPIEYTAKIKSQLKTKFVNYYVKHPDITTWQLGIGAGGNQLTQLLFAKVDGQIIGRIPHQHQNSPDLIFTVLTSDLAHFLGLQLPVLVNQTLLEQQVRHFVTTHLEFVITTPVVINPGKQRVFVSLTYRIQDATKFKRWLNDHLDVNLINTQFTALTFAATIIEWLSELINPLSDEFNDSQISGVISHHLSCSFSNK